MRILYVNWAPIWMGAEMGGGVNLYSLSMALEMKKKGHDVFAVSSGFTYNPGISAYIRKDRVHEGIESYEVVNSPILAPGFFNHEAPGLDLAAPVVERLFGELLREIRPDVVHFHNIEGFPASCIGVAGDAGARVVFSLHNYHPLCNQIYLLHRDETICGDYDDGNKCVHCIAPPPRERERLKRKAGWLIHRIPFGYRMWRLGGRILTNPRLRSLIAAVRGRRRGEESVPQARFDAGPDRSGAGYAHRRKGMVAALNRADLVLAVSQFVGTLYAGYGVRRDLIRCAHIGNAMAEIGLARSFSHVPKGADDRLKLVYMGICSAPKGLPFLLSTLDAMEDGELGRIDLHLHARGILGLEHLTGPLSGRLASLHLHDGYRFEDIPEILGGMDLGIVPPVWFDNAPQVVFEMLAMEVPVLGAAIGGIPDFVRDGENGLLFEPGDAASLTEKLRSVLLDTEMINRFREKITPMKTVAEHAGELEACYEKG